jgi:HlyD family secretion protein
VTPKRRPLVLILVALAVVVIVALVLRGRGVGRVVVASGTVEATEAQLGFPVSGRILEVVALEGDPVRPGQALAYLDTLETAAKRRQAAAQATAARALLLELTRGSRVEEIAQAKAALAAADEQLADARRDFARAQSLREGGNVSEESLQKATVALQVAESRQEQAAEQYRLVRTGPRTERIDAQRAQVAQADAAVAAIDAVLANLTVRAPFAGVVTVKNREPGEIVSAGSPVVTVLNRDDRWVRIYVPENRVGAVRLGQAATITSDTPPRRPYAGRVEFIASEAEFTPKSVQTQEERVKLVYAVKVRITGDPGYELKPGMPADVKLEAPKP